MTTKPDPERRQFLRKTGAAMTVVGSGGLATTTTVSAQSETDSPPQGILANELSIEGDARGAFIKAFMGSLMPSTSPTPKAENLASDMRNEFVANNDLWIEYGNWLIDTYDEIQPLGTVTLGIDVAVDRYYPNKNERVETTLQAVFDDETGKFTDLGWWIETPDDPDYQVEIWDKAARNASTELQEYRRRFIDETGNGNHKIPDATYRETMKGRYAAHLGFGENGANILEILVGGMN